MSEQEMKKILQELDHMPMPNKETVMAACEDAFEAKHIQKTERNGFKPIFVKQKAMRIAALAACVCLLITGVFGGLHLFGGENPSAITEQGTPNLPLDQYPPDEVDYANMSMVEYMELFPDFLSYRYMPWSEGYAFAHLEMLEIEEGYRQIAYKLTDGTFEYLKDTSGRGTHVRVRCRVVKDYWNKLEAGSEIDLFINSRMTVDYKHFNEDYTLDFLKNTDSFLMRLHVEQYYIYSNGNDEIIEDVNCNYLGRIGCFPLIDGKISLDGLNNYLNKIGEEPWYDIGVGGKPDFCSFSDVENIVADGMSLETAGENLTAVYDKYQTGEYNHINFDLVSQMNYGEYCRMLEGTLTEEDFDKFDTMLLIEYAKLPPLYSVEVSLSDGTKFEFCTRVKLSETLLERLVTETIVNLEAKCIEENGKLDAKKCIEMIKKAEFDYSLRALFGM